MTAEQQDALRKNNTERLRVMAARTGDIEDDDLETMDRTALLELVAKAILAKREIEKEAVGGGAVAGMASERTDTVRELELQIELKKMEWEATNKKMELENERKKMELEHEWRMAQMSKRDGRSDENVQNSAGGMDETGAETVGELDAGRFGGDRRRSRADVLADKVKRYGAALRQVVTIRRIRNSSIF